MTGYEGLDRMIRLGITRENVGESVQERSR